MNVCTINGKSYAATIGKPCPVCGSEVVAFEDYSEHRYGRTVKHGASGVIVCLRGHKFYPSAQLAEGIPASPTDAQGRRLLPGEKCPECGSTLIVKAGRVRCANRKRFHDLGEYQHGSAEDEASNSSARAS